MIFESVTHNPSSTFFQGLIWDNPSEEINSTQKIAIKGGILFIVFATSIIEPLSVVSAPIEVYSIRIKVSMRIGKSFERQRFGELVIAGWVGWGII